MICYHGSSVLFDSFDLSHILEGDGKAKYGYGLYFTDSYHSAAHYARNKKRPGNTDYYVYTVEVPDLTEDNHLVLYKRVPVAESIVKRVEEKLREAIPEEAKVEGIPFRKYLENRLIGNITTITQMTDKSTFPGKKAAAEFFASIGFDYYVWPVDWKKPETSFKDFSLLDDKKVRIIRIDKVELNPKKNYHLIEGSQVTIKTF